MRSCFFRNLMLPPVIRSPSGSQRILASPNKEFYHHLKNHLKGDVLDRVRVYFSGLEFTETIYGPGHFKVDKQMGKGKPFEECRFQEKIIRNGETFLISGIYSDDPPGLAPHPDDIINPFQLVPDGETGLVKMIRNRWIGIGVCAGLIAITVAIFIVASTGPFN